MPDAGAQQQIAPSGINFAPVEPLLKLKREAGPRPYECSSLHEEIRSWRNEIANRNLEERREIAESGRLMSNLRSGKLIMKRDPIFGSIALLKHLPRRPHNDAHIYPLAQVNSTQLTSIWTLSRPKITPRHFGNTNKAQIQHALIEKVIDHYDQTLMDEFFHQEESLSAMDYGTIAIRVDYDDKLNRMMELRPVTEDSTEEVFPGYGYCKNCSKEGVPEDFQSAADAKPRCPTCGDYNVSDMVPAQVADVPKVVGVEAVYQGDLTISLEKIPALNWDMRVLIHNSPWVHKLTEVSRNLAEALIGAQVSGQDPENDYGLRVINALGTRGGSAHGWGRENLYGNYEIANNVAIMEEIWFKPEWYAGRRLQKEEKTVSGETIPKDVPFEQIWPDGMCVTGLNELKILTGIFNEPCRIKGGVYHIQSFSGVGKGTQDAIEISEHLNVAHSAAMAIIKRYAAGGGTWYDSEVLSEEEVRRLNKPGALVGVRMRGTQYNSIDQAMKRIEAGSLDQSNLSIIAQLSNMLNIVFQTTDFTSGVADDRVDVNTLGGQQLLQAQNQQRSAAPLRMKAYLRSKVFEDVIELFRTHISIPKYFGTNDKYGLSKGKFISGTDFPEKIKCDAQPNSEQPQNDMTDRENFKAMLEATGQSGMPFFEIVQMSPRVAAWVASKFRTELPLFNYTEILIVCQERLDAVKQLAATEEQVAELSGLYEDPAIVGQMIVDQLQIMPTEDNHVIKAQVLQEYLDDDEVKAWGQYQRAAVQALIWTHYRADVAFRTSLAALEQQAQMGLAQQAMAAQQQAEAPMREAEAQAREQEGADRREDILVEKMAGLVEGEESFAREQEGADRQSEREEAKAGRDHKRSMELEKHKAKFKPKPSAKRK